MMPIIVLMVALLCLLFLIRKPLGSMVIGGLDRRGERIRAELDEANRLHEEARALLDKHRAKLVEGENAAAEIVAHAQSEAKRLEERLKAEMEHALKRREELALERISQEETRALRDVRTRAAHLAVQTTRQILTEHLGGDGAQAVMKSAISEVKQKLA
ncbi:MAG: F0F1 ATP synthase subunit B [Geminicoccaceae bacterium]|nr:F0F1 ATP synthase subunit B [Geminicoccaceae bacterium]